MRGIDSWGLGRGVCENSNCGMDCWGKTREEENKAQRESSMGSVSALRGSLTVDTRAWA